MPYSITYTKTLSHSIGGSTNSFSRSTPTTYTGSGSERRLVNETLPSGVAGYSGIYFTFSTGSGSFLGFSTQGSKPLLISGVQWPSSAVITLTGTNQYNSFFVRTGQSDWTNPESLSIYDISGQVYIKNPNTGQSVTFVIESLSDTSPGWGTVPI